MSNERYFYGNQAFLSGQLNWTSDIFRICLVDTTQYVFLQAVHQTLADVPLTAQVAISPALTGTTATNGVAVANTVVIPSVSGPLIKALIIFKDTGTRGTSTLVAYLDTVVGLPVNPQGRSISIAWDPLGIFRL